MRFRAITQGVSLLPAALSLLSCTQVPKTTQFDESLTFTEINGYKFHTEVFGRPQTTPIIIVHGGPGGDHGYLKALSVLSHKYRVIYYDQRGSGLSPRVDKKDLTLKRSLEDLHAIVEHFSSGQKVKLLGHSWGGMLVAGYLSVHPEKVSQAVIVEPGMLHRDAAKAFVSTIKKSQAISDMFALIKYIAAYPFVAKLDGHEGFDYVMTKLLNRPKRGGPYQCEGESMPPDSFQRAGYEAFNNMLKPVMDNPDGFDHNLTKGISRYRGDLMLISSECSLFGYDFQNTHHIPKLPSQTIHIKAENMGHNMLTLNAEWSLGILDSYFN